MWCKTTYHINLQQDKSYPNSTLMSNNKSYRTYCRSFIDRLHDTFWTIESTVKKLPPEKYSTLFLPFLKKTLFESREIPNRNRHFIVIVGRHISFLLNITYSGCHLSSNLWGWSVLGSNLKNFVFYTNRILMIIYVQSAYRHKHFPN